MSRFRYIRARFRSIDNCLLDPTFDGEFPERLPRRYYATGQAVADASGDSFAAWQRENCRNDSARANMSYAQAKRWGVWVNGINPSL